MATVALCSCTAVSERTPRAGDMLDGQTHPIPFTIVAGDYDTPPVFEGGRAPVFPPKLAFAGAQFGNATLRYRITVEGRATTPRVVTANHPQFAAGVAHVMPTWRFQPAKRNGVPVEVIAETSIKFGVEAATFGSKPGTK